MSNLSHRVAGSPELRVGAQLRRAEGTRSRMSVAAIPGGFLRMGVAKEIASVLKDIGLDPASVIRDADLDPALFDDGDNVISFVALGRLVTLCVARTKCEHFGLLVGQKATISGLGPVGGLMQHSPTVGEALRNLIQHIHLCDRGAAPLLTISGGEAMLSYAIYQPGVESTDQIADAVMALGAVIMRTLCGTEWSPGEVLLPRQLPVDPGLYRRLFRATVRFDQETAALMFPARWLDHEIAGADPVFRQIFDDRVRELEASNTPDFADDLRRILRTRILAGRCSAEAVATMFAMHRRTLNRHLNQEGKCYQDIIDETRFEVARQLLNDTKLPLSHVAAALGYSEASAFTRAFRRWSGQTPTAWRTATVARVGMD